MRFGASYESCIKIKESTVFIFTSQKTEIAKSACKLKWQTRAPCRRRTGEALPRAEKFGDMITADHKVLNEEGESRNNHRYAVVVQDLVTQWNQSYPCKTKTSQETEKRLRKFLDPSQKSKSYLYEQFIGIWKTLWRSIMESSDLNTLSIRDKWHCWKSSTQSKRRNFSSIAAIRIGWWADLMKCYCYLRNVQDLLAEVKTPCERRFGEPFKGPIIPFGAMVEYYPISTRDQSRLHQLNWSWENLERRCSHVADLGRIGKVESIRKFSSKN